MLYGMHTENWMAALLHYFIYLCFYIYANFMVLIQKRVMTIVQWIRLGFINSIAHFFSSYSLFLYVVFLSIYGLSQNQPKDTHSHKKDNLHKFYLIFAERKKGSNKMLGILTLGRNFNSLVVFFIQNPSNDGFSSYHKRLLRENILMNFSFSMKAGSGCTFWLALSEFFPVF